MAIVKTDDKHYKNLAAAIRSRTGNTHTYKPEDLPAGVDAVFIKGYDVGKSDGIVEGYMDGARAGEEEVKAIFWNNYQIDGGRQNYNYAFAGSGWTEDLFYPQYDICATSGYQMFAYSGFAGSLKQRLAACKVSLTFSGSGSFMNLFANAEKITELGVLDFSALTGASNTHIFNQCKALKTIEEIVVSPTQTSWASWFSGCTALENVRFEGTINTGGLNLSACPRLNISSLLSVLNALADKSGSSDTEPNLILGATNLAKLTNAQKNIAIQKGWTLA